MSNIIAEPLLKYVVSQIKARQKAHGSGVVGNTRTPEYLAYLNSSTSWVKLASGVDISKERLKSEGISDNFSGTTLAKNRVLFGGTSRVNSGKLIQRGTSTNSAQNNITDYYTGTYNVNQNQNNTSLEFGPVPMPGIVSVDVKSKNRGSIEEANIKIKAYTREQFDFINLLYLRLGYTVLLEWGNGTYLDSTGKIQQMGYTLIEDSSEGFFSNTFKKSSYKGLLKKIERFRSRHEGNYDGMMAKVKNFSWKFSEDGSYDIDISLIGLGDVMESLKVNITPSNALLSTIKIFQSTNTDEETMGDSSPVDSFLSAYLFFWRQSYAKQLEDGTLGEKKITIKSSNGTLTPIGYFLKLQGEFTQEVDDYYEGIDTETDLKALFAELKIKYDMGGTWDEVYGGFQQTVEGKGTIRLEWGYDGGGYDYEMEVYGNVKLDPKNDIGTSGDSSGKDVVFLDYLNEEGESDETSSYYMRFGHLLSFIEGKLIPKIEGSDNIPQIRINSGQWSNRMYKFPYQLSHDPRVCIVKSQIIENDALDLIDVFPQLVDWEPSSPDGYAYMMNIYVNFNTITSAMEDGTDSDGNLNLFTLLENICISLNTALGGVNNLEPIINKEKNQVTIIDSSYSSTKKPASYELEMFGYNNTSKSSNFVRGFDLKTTISKEYADMITIGATAGGYVKGVENTMFSKWNKGIVDRYKPNLIEGDVNTKDPGSRKKINEALSNYTDFFIQERIGVLGYKYKDIGWVFTDQQPMLDADLINKNLSIATEFYKYAQYQLQQQVPDYASPTNGFIPFSLGLTFDGISGIKIYNSINVNTSFLPKNYPKALRFVIKSVNHKLTNQNWETNIETIVIPETLNSSGGKILNYSKLYSRVTSILSGGVENQVAQPSPPPSPPTPAPRTNTESGPRVPEEGNLSNVSSASEIPNIGKSVPKDLINSTSTAQDAVDYIIGNLEGGYYHPSQAFTLTPTSQRAGQKKSGNSWQNTSNVNYIKEGYKIMKNSGETIFGIDRVAGGWMNSTEGATFWSAIDKISGNGQWGGQAGDNSKKRTRAWNYVPKNAGSWGYNSQKGGVAGAPDLLPKAGEMIKKRYDKYMGNSFGNHPSRAVIESDGRGIFMFYRAVWNGSGYLQKYALNIIEKYNSGITNVEGLIDADLVYRWNTKSDSFKKGVNYLKQAMAGF